MKHVAALCRHFALSLCLLAAAVGTPVFAAEPPTGTTAGGRVAGSWQDGLRVFRGIPYAAPPIGERRWRPPAPPVTWTGLRDARTFGPDCVQPSYPAASVYFEPPRAMSEDCLTLNIWAPERADGAPVIVWIHGGALQFGSSASPMYDGAEFAKRGIVFVSINYRLGVFGWLAHPALSAESAEGVSGNYGLLDQMAALIWVRRNIGGFGGDPANVTVMGESAGALSATYLLASPRAKDLFAKAIVQSPNMRAVPHLRDAAFGMPSAEATGTALAGSLGAADLAALRRIDPKALVAAGVRARFIAQPVVDGAILPGQLVDIFDRGEQAKIPVLAGFNSGEVRSQRALVPPAPADAATYDGEATARYGDLAPAFLRLYPASDREESLLAATRDAVYGWATERLVREQTRTGQPAYLYLFDHCYAAARARGLCAFHASELPFAFGVAGRPLGGMPNWPMPAGEADRALAARMIDYWAAFAANGTPAADDAPAWPAYGDAENFMRFGARPVAESDLLPGMFEFQEDIMQRRRGAGEQWFTNREPLQRQRLVD